MLPDLAKLRSPPALQAVDSMVLHRDARLLGDFDRPLPPSFPSCDHFDDDLSSSHSLLPWIANSNASSETTFSEDKYLPSPPRADQCNESSSAFNFDDYLDVSWLEEHKGVESSKLVIGGAQHTPFDTGFKRSDSSSNSVRSGPQATSSTDTSTFHGQQLEKSFALTYELSSTSDCFDSNVESLQPDSAYDSSTTSLYLPGATTPNLSPVDRYAAHDSSHARTTKFCSRDKILPIKVWLQANAQSPYPDDTKVLELSSITGLTPQQVRVCMANQRARRGLKGTRSRKSRVASCSSHVSPGSISCSVMPHDTPSTTIPNEAVDARSRVNILSPTLTGFDSASKQNAQSFSSHPSEILNPSMHIPDIRDTNTVLKASSTPHASENGRQGRRVHPYRYPSHTGETTVGVLGGCRSSTKNTSGIYHCTVCTKSFKAPYDWKRHEAAVHFRVEKWVCMGDGTLISADHCVFCSKARPTPVHFDKHQVTLCLCKDAAAKTFSREDHMKQHVQQAHLAAYDDACKRSFRVPSSWKIRLAPSELEPEALWCGFCRQALNTWDDRVQHVGEHFREGCRIEDWSPLLALEPQP